MAEELKKSKRGMGYLPRTIDDYVDYWLKDEAAKYGLTVLEYMEYCSRYYTKHKNHTSITPYEMDVYLRAVSKRMI